MCLGLVTQPPAPSQWEGEILLVKFFLSTHSLSKPNLKTKGVSPSLWEGAGGWVVYLTPTHHLRTPHANKKHKPLGTSYLVICNYQGQAMKYFICITIFTPTTAPTFIHELHTRTS